MPETQEFSTAAAPSKRAIAKAAAIAFGVALVLLFTVVLPAEYGFDPLGTGRILRLTGLSQAPSSEASGRAAATVETGQPRIYTPQPAIYKVDSQDFQLRPGDGVEMKYHMEKGASMVYGWKGDGKLAFEFHGEPDRKPSKDYFESYELNEKPGKDSSYGSFTAPSTGIHGWFWQNKGKKDVTFHLSVAGFFDSAKMYVDGKPDDVPVTDAK